MDRWPIFSSPSLCGSSTEKEYTSPDLSATSSSSSAGLNTRDVHLLATHLLHTSRGCQLQHGPGFMCVCVFQATADKSTNLGSVPHDDADNQRISTGVWGGRSTVKLSTKAPQDWLCLWKQAVSWSPTWCWRSATKAHTPTESAVWSHQLMLPVFVMETPQRRGPCHFLFPLRDRHHWGQRRSSWRITAVSQPLILCSQLQFLPAFVLLWVLLRTAAIKHKRFSAKQRKHGKYFIWMLKCNLKDHQSLYYFI